MKKIILYFFISILGSNNITAQNFVYPFYNIEKDKPWIDSLKHIVKKNFIQDEQQRNNWKKQLIFVNTCVELGMYYERLFEQKKLPDLKQALVYYNKVADMERFPDDSKYFKALAVRTTLFRKLSAIYFKGKGVKKDRQYSLELALKGIVGNPQLFKFYSKRYFGSCTGLISKDKKINYAKDVVFRFKINPFVETLGLNDNILNDKYLTAISNAFLRRQKNENFTLFIESSTRTTLKDQAISYKLMDAIKSLLVEKKNINPDLVTTNSDINNEEDYALDFFFQKNQ